MRNHKREQILTNFWVLSVLRNNILNCIHFWFTNQNLQKFHQITRKILKKRNITDSHENLILSLCEHIFANKLTEHFWIAVICCVTKNVPCRNIWLNKLDFGQRTNVDKIYTAKYLTDNVFWQFDFFSKKYV